MNTLDLLLDSFAFADDGSLEVFDALVEETFFGCFEEAGGGAAIFVFGGEGFGGFGGVEVVVGGGAQAEVVAGGDEGFEGWEVH